MFMHESSHPPHPPTHALTQPPTYALTHAQKHAPTLTCSHTHIHHTHTHTHANIRRHPVSHTMRWLALSIISVYVCWHIHTHTNTYTYTYRYMCTHTYTHTHARMICRLHSSSRKFVRVYVCMYVYVTCIYVWVHVCIERQIEPQIFVHVCIICVHVCTYVYGHGVATISRLLKIIGLFCRISSLLQGSFAKETYDFKEPTNRSHPIYVCITWQIKPGMIVLDNSATLMSNTHTHTHTHARTHTYTFSLSSFSLSLSLTHTVTCKYTHFWYAIYLLADRHVYVYGVATFSRLLQNIGLFCRISSLL